MTFLKIISIVILAFYIITCGKFYLKETRKQNKNLWLIMFISFLLPISYILFD